ncbi:hypothetical protein [Streptomyces sp. NPDC091215]|uniref:hypothetical protein n=1 Tax=Streptomyces sp. NPDC091215 TaxID=3155192 RepID=UPI003413A601
MRLTEWTELLRKDLAEVGAEPGRSEAAEVVFGQCAEATDGGRRPSGIVERERVEGMGLEALTSEYLRIMEIVARAGGPVMGKEVAMTPGRELTPGKVEPVSGQLRKLADQGWLKRTGSGCYLPRRPTRGRGPAGSRRNASVPGGS